MIWPFKQKKYYKHTVSVGVCDICTVSMSKDIPFIFKDVEEITEDNMRVHEITKKEYDSF
jgi:hypothetical protein